MIKIIEGIHAGHKVGDGSKPLFVGVINLSPESFFKGSIAGDVPAIEKKIEDMYKYGVGCLDVGGMSTRPLNLYDGKRASVKEETQRIKKYLPKIIEIAGSYEIPVALDTQYSEVAKIAIEEGCSVINDISGLHTDPQLADVVASHDVDIVLMASNDKPGDVCGIDETITALQWSIELAREKGIKKERIVVDPAFGGWEGRGSSCDLKLIQNFAQLQSLELPIYIGVSRKSTIKNLGGGDLPDDRLVGSVVLTNWLIEHGAHIIRTHDVKETVLGYQVYKSLSSGI